jgi:hypothetical protein
VVIVFSTDIVVIKGLCIFYFLKEEGLLVEALLEDGMNAFV